MHECLLLTIHSQDTTAVTTTTTRVIKEYSNASHSVNVTDHGCPGDNEPCSYCFVTIKDICKHVLK